MVKLANLTRDGFKNSDISIFPSQLTGNVDYFLKVDHTGYAEKDWLLITNQELKQLEERA